MVHKQKVAYSRLSSRIAEEKQLLAEEKWIIEALTKIRNQRNCLQIERLELESVKSQLIIDNRSLLSPPLAPAPRLPPTPAPSLPPTPAPLESAVKLMASNPTAAGASLWELEETLANELVEETYCNEQQLDLTVTNPILSLNFNDMNVEEEESDGSDDSQDENTDSILIDMNMFMNGKGPSL